MQAIAAISFSVAGGIVIMLMHHKDDRSTISSLVLWCARFHVGVYTICLSSNTPLAARPRGGLIHNRMFIRPLAGARLLMQAPHNLIFEHPPCRCALFHVVGFSFSRRRRTELIEHARHARRSTKYGDAILEDVDACVLLLPNPSTFPQLLLLLLPNASTFSPSAAAAASEPEHFLSAAAAAASEPEHFLSQRCCRVASR